MEAMTKCRFIKDGLALDEQGAYEEMLAVTTMPDTLEVRQEWKYGLCLALYFTDSYAVERDAMLGLARFVMEGHDIRAKMYAWMINGGWKYENW